MKRLALIGLLGLSLAACATPTAFAPAARPNGVGFSDMRIEQDRYRVTFQGGGGAPAAQVEDYALLRSAIITLDAGYDWFRVVGGRLGIRRAQFGRRRRRRGVRPRRRPAPVDHAGDQARARPDPARARRLRRPRRAADHRRAGRDPDLNGGSRRAAVRL